MKVLRTIVIILLVIFAGYCIWMLTLPKEFTMERSTMINAKPQAVFAEVNNLDRWPAWSPWNRLDSNMTMEYSDSHSGQGAYYTWSGNPDKVGSGKYTNAEVDQNKYIKYDMEFNGMEQSDGYWKFEPLNDDKTKVTWGFHTTFGFFHRIGSYFIEKAIGPQFEQGLANLKETVETTSPEEMTPITITTVDVQPMEYYGITEEIPMTALTSDRYAERYQQIANYLGEDAKNMTGPPFAIFYTWDEDNGTTKVEFAIPATSSKPGNDQVKKGTSYSGKALKAIHHGDYRELQDEHLALGDYITNHNLKINGGPWEVYVTDPSSQPDTSQWITEVYYPIKDSTVTASAMGK